MPLRLEQSEYFLADVEAQFRWYLEKGGVDVARRYRVAVQATLARLHQLPDIGRPRFHEDAELTGLRSVQVVKPFNNQLLFYRVAGEVLIVERTMHGSRDLPRRLKQSPHESGG